MAGEGNPTDPAQARMQVSIHVKVVGLLLVQRGARSNPHALWDTISRHNTPECGGNAGVPDDVRAAETAFVHLCLQIWATVDTTHVTSCLSRKHWFSGTAKSSCNSEKPGKSHITTCDKRICEKQVSSVSRQMEPTCMTVCDRSLGMD